MPVQQQVAIIPHGHANMVSAHLVLSGSLYLRLYDQIERDENSLLVRPSFEGVIGAGALSSIDEFANNVHWFIAEEPSHTFDVIVSGLVPGEGRNYDIFNLDMDAARQEAGNLRVPQIDVETALHKYG